MKEKVQQGKGNGWQEGGQVAVLNRGVRISPIEKVKCEQRLEGGRVFTLHIWEKRALGRGNTVCPKIARRPVGLLWRERGIQSNRR